MSTYTSPEVLRPRDINEALIRDYGGLLLTLTDRNYNPAAVKQNLLQATASPTTNVYAIRRQPGRTVVSTLTVNHYDILAPLMGNGLSWIDDVVTNEADQGHGLSGMLMTRGERDAASHGPVVLLTSSPQRGVARGSYERHGYVPTGGVWRRQLGGVASDGQRLSTIVESVDDRDVDAVKEVLPNRQHLGARMRAIAESPSSGLFMARGSGGSVAAIALAHLCPIPVGYKPWISMLFDASDMAGEEVLGEAEVWVSRHHPSVNFFVVPGLSEGLPTPEDRGYALRNTGLFVKQFAQT